MRKSVFLCAIAWTATLGAADRRPITETDLLKFQWVADPQISPDGREVAYVLVTVNEKEDRYDTSLWSVATTGSAAPRRLTVGPRDSSPLWSPDARTIAFTRAPGEKDKPQIQLVSSPPPLPPIPPGRSHRPFERPR
jgi:dipeptidyl aminopeptidase/acylaminoacyl peptidase